MLELWKRKQIEVLPILCGENCWELFWNFAGYLLQKRIYLQRNFRSSIYSTRCEDIFENFDKFKKLEFTMKREVVHSTEWCIWDCFTRDRFNINCSRLPHRVARFSHKYGIRFPRDFIMCFIRLLDPHGVTDRKSRCLKRRSYRSGGPNFLCHCDGYDKLKPYGFPIHGGIEGFSRKIRWLRVVRSNKTLLQWLLYLSKLLKSWAYFHTAFVLTVVPKMGWLLLLSHFAIKIKTTKLICMARHTTISGLKVGGLNFDV